MRYGTDVSLEQTHLFNMGSMFTDQNMYDQICVFGRENKKALFSLDAANDWKLDIGNLICNAVRRKKKGKRKVQEMTQSQAAALPRHEEEEEADKSKQAQNEQTYEKH